MRATTAIVLAAAPLLSLSAPLFTRAGSETDLLVMNFANVLEGLETEFYKQALAKFTESDFQTAGYSSAQVPIEQFTTIMGDEAAHAKILNSSIGALGGKLVEGCQFSFDSVLGDVTTMAATARVVENLGVSAYLGAAHLIQDPRILEAAGSILTVEARHQTVLNIMSGSGSVIPQAFDVALAPAEVLAVASGFITGCDVGVKANPTLTITNKGTVSAGTLLTFSSDAMPSDTSNLHCHMIVGGAVNSISLPMGQCVVPATVNGPVAIWITTDSQPVLNNVVDRDTSKELVAGPTMAFIDAKQEALSGLVRTGGGASTTSENISPAEASGVASSGSSGSSDNSTAGGPILTTGDGGDGIITVNGWTNLPSSS